MNRLPWGLALLSGSVALAACASPSVPPPAPAPASAPARGSAPLAPPTTQQHAAASGEGTRSTAIANEANGAQAGYEVSAVTYTASDRIIFHSNQGAFGFGLPGYPGSRDSDIFLYEPRTGQVSALAGINTPDPELNARISDNGRWVVFQRTTGSSHQEILLFDTRNQTIDNLPALNNGGNAYMPDISNDARYIVYVHRAGTTGTPQLRLYDNATGRNSLLPVASASFRDITWPSISGDGQRIAFGASTVAPIGTARDLTGRPSGGGAVTGLPGPLLGSDIYVYNLNGGGTPTLVSQASVNTSASEYNPELSCDGRYMLFVSNRLGQEDIYEADLQANVVDTLPLLNNIPNLNVGQADARRFPLADKQHPRYLGEDHNRILFQIKPAGIVGTTTSALPTPAIAFVPSLPVALPTPAASSGNPFLNLVFGGLFGTTPAATPSLAPLVFATPRATPTPRTFQFSDSSCVCTETTATFPVQLRVYDRSNGQLDMLSAVNSFLYGSGLRAPQSELLP